MTEESGSERPEGELPSYVPGAPDGGDTPPRRRKGTTVAVGIGVAVAMVAGVLALATLTSDSGSGTPEAAVRKLADAVANEDVLGALDALVPAERDVVRDRLFDITAELGRLGVLDDELDLAHVPGADLTFTGLELTTEPLSDDLASVLVTGGTAGLSLAPADLPAGSLVRSYLDGSDGAIAPPATTPLGNDDDVRVVTVREGGDWFVSLGYTLAESIRRDSDAGDLKVDQAVAPKGAASPKEAVEEFARAAAALDTRRLVELAAPGEAAAVHAYAPLFLKEAAQWADDVHADGLQATIDQLELSSKESGDVARVTIDRLAVGLASPGGRSVFAFDGRCLRFDQPDQPDQPGDPSAHALCPDDDELNTVQRTMFEGLTLTVARHDGAWYLSPVGTQLDTTVAALRSLDRAELEAAIAEDKDPGVIGGAIAPMVQLALAVFFRVAFGSYGDEGESFACVGSPIEPGNPDANPLLCEEPGPVPGPVPVPVPQPTAAVATTAPGTIGARPSPSTSEPTREPPTVPVATSTTNP